jgi:hypothetical protein
MIRTVQDKGACVVFVCLMYTHGFRPVSLETVPFCETSDIYFVTTAVTFLSDGKRTIARLGVKNHTCD